MVRKLLVACLCAGGSLQAASIGAADGWNAFVFETITYSNTSTSAGLAAGVDITLTNMFISDDVAAGNTSVQILSAGSVDLQNGSVNGSVQYGTTGSNTATLPPGATFAQAPSPFDFAMEKVFYQNISNQLASHPANGTATFEFGTLTLTGTDLVTNYFTVDPLASAANNVIINIPAGATAIITLTGTSVNYMFGGMDTGGTPASHIVWNVPNATTVAVSGVPLQGTILAPMAAVDLTNGTIRGQVISNQLTGASAKLEFEDFDGNLGPATVPEPSTFLLAGSVLAVVLWRSRRVAKK